ncbi:uncharacterized protein LOC111332000 [Stylophora pistillata]|uniref:uncharacterized protein LOC111332000 n=1 Tax=Stylophora pistillata TaxID=50429 RepID=UPI000C05226A|nr:uncharacterized protein LOC111332000 [Stylophora pistillata]
MACGETVERMPEAYRNLLREVKVQLANDMEPGKVLLRMSPSLVFSTDDEEIIEAENTRMNKNKRLLEILMRKPAKAYESFKEALRADQPHLAGLIDNAEISNKAFQKAKDELERKKGFQEAGSQSENEDAKSQARGQPARDKEVRKQASRIEQSSETSQATTQPASGIIDTQLSCSSSDKPKTVLQENEDAKSQRRGQPAREKVVPDVVQSSICSIL